MCPAIHYEVYVLSHLIPRGKYHYYPQLTHRLTTIRENCPTWCSHWLAQPGFEPGPSKSRAWALTYSIVVPVQDTGRLRMERNSALFRSSGWAHTKNYLCLTNNIHQLYFSSVTELERYTEKEVIISHVKCIYKWRISNKMESLAV